jgi:CRP-like cAMP-binding protein
MQATHIELLQGMPVFGALREDSLRLLLHGARETVVQVGAHFFHEGDAANSMFVLQSGRVAVHKQWRGQELRLNELVAGDCFGEMALMDLLPRSASVRAETTCQAIEFSSHDLMRLYEHDVEQFALIQMNLGREVCRRLRATDELLFRWGMGEAPVVMPPLFSTA